MQLPWPFLLLLEPGQRKGAYQTIGSYIMSGKEKGTKNVKYHSINNTLLQNPFSSTSNFNITFSIRPFNPLPQV